MSLATSSVAFTNGVGAQPGPANLKRLAQAVDDKSGEGAASPPDKMKQVMAAAKLPANRAYMIKKQGVLGSAGVLTYFEGRGGIRTLNAATLGELDFYFREPHDRNLQVVTAKVLRGQTSALGHIPNQVRTLQVGDSVIYQDRADTLAEGRGQVAKMGDKDSDAYRLIGAWTISDRSSVKISRIAGTTYKINVVSDSVAVDKYDWNVGKNDPQRFTRVETRTGFIDLSHADMYDARKFGAKDFWLTGAVKTEATYIVPAAAMNKLLAGENLDMKQFKLPETLIEIKSPQAFREAITSAYTQNARGKRSAAVPPQAEVIRPLALPK